MKKTILLSFALLVGAAVYAQKTSSGPGGTTTPVTTSIPADCYVNKTWKLSKVEKFGITKDPGDAQKNDMLQLNQDGTFKMVVNGVEKTGSWTRGSWLSLKPADGSETLPVKIESCGGGTLKADWRDGDTHNHFTYVQ